MYGFYFYGQPFWGQGPGGSAPEPPIIPEPPKAPAATTKRAKSGGLKFQTREEAWRAQEALAIAADDEELISLVAKLMEEIDP